MVVVHHYSHDHYTIRLPRVADFEWPDKYLPELSERVPYPMRLVTSGSSLKSRKAMFVLARCFRREFEYDGVQWGHEGDERDINARGFLFVDNAHDKHGKVVHYAVGATCFRWREWTDHPAGWSMQWAWLHPFARRQGTLSGVWPFFRKEFGNFHIARPLSLAMEAFVAKMRAPDADALVTALAEAVTNAP